MHWLFTEIRAWKQKWRRTLQSRPQQERIWFLEEETRKVFNSILILFRDGILGRHLKNTFIYVPGECSVIRVMYYGLMHRKHNILHWNQWRLEVRQRGGYGRKKSRVPSLTQEGLRNSVKGEVLPFFRAVQIQRRAKAPWPQWSRRHWLKL